VRPSLRPILLIDALRGRRRRVLDLDPAIVTARPIRRAQALRDNALAAKRTGLFVDDGAVDFEMAVERDAWSRTAQ